MYIFGFGNDFRLIIAYDAAHRQRQEFDNLAVFYNDLPSALFDQVIYCKGHVLGIGSHNHQVVIVRCIGGRHSAFFQFPSRAESQ